MVAEEASRLLLAARNGDLSSLRSENLTESLQDEHGATCLHYAARGGQVPVVQHLINARSFHPSKRSNVGATALHDGAATGQLEALKWLLENNDVKVDDQDGTGATVTHLSARYGHTQTLEWLLDNTNCDVLKKSASGALPLHFAAEGGHVECVKLLVSEAPRSVNMQMNNGCTPVYLACQSGHLLTAEYLASNNGTPKIHTFDGMSPLHASAQTGQLHMIKWLIQEQGLNPNERDFDGATPLHYAASKGHTEVVDWMLREGGARIILDNLGGSPLHTAAEFGNNKILMYNLTGDAAAKQAVEGTFASWFPGGSISYTPKGLAWRLQWGSLRYSSNMAMAALMAAQSGINVDKYRHWAMCQIHYALGDTGFSYVIGYGDQGWPKRPHHRASSCPMAPAPCGSSMMMSKAPNPHTLYGALVGGPDESDSYTDSRDNYVNNEVACDYNSGLQTAIAALRHLWLIHQHPEQTGSDTCPFSSS